MDRMDQSTSTGLETFSISFLQRHQRFNYFVCIRAHIRHAKNSQRKYILLTVHINLNRATSTSMLIPKRRALANIHSREGRQLEVLDVFGTSNHDRRNTWRIFLLCLRWKFG